MIAMYSMYCIDEDDVLIAVTSNHEVESTSFTPELQRFAFRIFIFSWHTKTIFDYYMSGMLGYEYEYF